MYRRTAAQPVSSTFLFPRRRSRRGISIAGPVSVVNPRAVQYSTVALVEKERKRIVKYSNTAVVYGVLTQRS